MPIFLQNVAIWVCEARAAKHVRSRPALTIGSVLQVLPNGCSPDRCSSTTRVNVPNDFEPHTGQYCSVDLTSTGTQIVVRKTGWVAIGFSTDEILRSVLHLTAKSIPFDRLPALFETPGGTTTNAFFSRCVNYSPTALNQAESPPAPLTYQPKTLRSSYLRTVRTLIHHAKMRGNKVQGGSQDYVSLTTVLHAFSWALHENTPHGRDKRTYAKRTYAVRQYMQATRSFKTSCLQHGTSR